MDLVRTVGKAQGADAGIGLGEARVVGNAAAAPGLDRIVDDLQRHVRRRHLDHGDFELRGLVADLVHHVGGLEAQQPGHLDVGAGFGDALFPDRLLDDLLAERSARRQPPHHLLQRLFGDADGAHAVMDAAGTEAALRDLETAALAEQDVFSGNADVFEQHLGMAVRRVVEAEHGKHLLDGDAGGVERHQDLRLLLMPRGVGIGLAHQDRDLAAGIAVARRPPFTAVDDVVIAVACDRGFDVGGVRRGDRGFGHQEGGADLAVHQRLQPFALLLLAGIAHEHFHVAGIRRRAVEHFGGEGDVAHFLRQRRVFQVAQSRAAEFIVLMRGRRHEHVPEAFGLRLLLEVFENRDHLPARTLGVLLLVDRHCGPDMLGHERLYAIEPILLAIRHIEVHGRFLTL